MRCCISTAEILRASLYAVIITLLFGYLVPVLIVKEDVRIVSRYYTVTGYLVGGIDANTRKACGYMYLKDNQVHAYMETFLWDLRALIFGSEKNTLENPIILVSQSNYTLWVLVHPVNMTLPQACPYLHWHIAGQTDNEEDAKYWTTQTYDKGCADGAFIAHVMNPITYLYEKLWVGYERGPIAGTIFDVVKKEL